MEMYYFSQKVFVATSDKRTTINSPSINYSLVHSRQKPVQVTYLPKPEDTHLSGLSDADFIYEYINEDGQITYKGIFYNKVPKKTSPVVSIRNMALSSLPELNFSDSPNYSDSTTKKANYIFVTMSYNMYSNFIYQNGSYTHFRDNYKDIDKSNYSPINVSNVVVQIYNSNEYIEDENVGGEGDGLLFSDGKVVEIKWQNNGKKLIKIVDEKGNPVSLAKGKTWWTIVNSNCPVAYN